MRIRGKEVRHGVLIALIIILVLSQARCSVGSIYGRYADAGKYTAGNFSYKAKDISSVEIDWVSSDIKVVQKDAGTLNVSETDRGLKQKQRLHWYKDGSKLIIRFCRSGYRGRIPAGTKALTVEVPEGIDLTINTVSGNVNLTGDQTYDKVSINSVSGNVACDTLCADKADIKTVSGECGLDSCSLDKIDVETVSGNVTAGLAECGKAQIKTVSGEVTFTKLPDGGAEIDYDHASGSLNAQGYSKDGDKYIFGQGKCKIEVETMSGDLAVE